MEHLRHQLGKILRVIGEGAYLAQSVLLQRGHSDVKSLEETLYCVYEAKRYAERVSSVGKDTLLVIVYANGKTETVTPQGFEFLAKKFSEYGPRQLGNDIQLDEKFFRVTIEEQSA